MAEDISSVYGDRNGGVAEHLPSFVDRAALDKIVGTMESADGSANDMMEASPPLGADAPIDASSSSAAPSASPAAAASSQPPQSLSRPSLVRRTSTNCSGEKTTTTAPEPPRWRFVKEAKKSMGYSSLHAGSYIRGMSSEELGAKYTTPDITLYKPKKEVAEVDRQPAYELPKKKAPEKNVEVGKLESQEESIEVEEYVGWSPGFARDNSNADGPRDPYKDWGVNVLLSPKPGREQEWFDGEYNPSFSSDVESHTPYVPPVESTPPGEDTTHSSPNCVGRLQFHDVPESEDIFVGEYHRHQKALQSVGMDSGESNGIGHVIDGFDEMEEPNLDEENRLSSKDHEGTFYVDGDASRDDTASSTQESKEEDDNKKRKYCCFLLPLLLILLAAILGGVFGKKRDGDPTEGAPATGIAAPPPIIVFVDNETAVPSSSPSTVCPLGFKPFAIEGAHQPSSVGGNVTWRITDACSGDLVAQCLPCPEESKSLFETRAIEPDGDFLGGRETLECLPANGEYAMEILSTEDSSEECCGFDANSVISFDAVPMNVVNGGEGLFGGVSDTTYFGERDVPCPSAPPSLVASAQPSFEPSSIPSFEPTNFPTRSPVVFMGACPQYFRAGADYAVGAQVAADNLVYECSENTCGSFWFGLGDLAVALWSQGWIPIGSCLGTKPPTDSPTLSPSFSPTPPPARSPSLSPSRKPTASPTLRPTPPPTNAPTTRQPTRQPTEEPTASPTCSEPEFDVCFAIDMSGSVCPGDDNGCKDFESMQEFAIEMVAELDELPGESSFSVVEFASDSDIASGLSPALTAALAIEGLDYSAGATNTAGAIDDCQQSLRAATLQRKKFMMLITDGQPTEPDPDDKAIAAAEDAATSAKAAGTIIIPIFISKVKDFEKEALEFMERISSDGTFFDVTGFDSLVTLQDVLVEEVANCGRAGLDGDGET